jgi:hypothetical protein
MTAIILNPIKDIFVQKLFNENQGTTPGDSGNYYYIGIGRSQQWQPSLNTDTPTTPADTERTERLFRYNLQAIKAIEAYSYVVPLYDWTSNTVYTTYNDNIVGQPSQSYYVRTDDNNVYVCIRQGKSAAGVTQVSQNKPIHTGTTLPIEADGYIWKFLYTITTANANSFLTSNFMPVKLVDSALPTDPEFSQYSVQNSAIIGQILGYRVINGGSGYSSPTLQVIGDGTGAAAYPIVSSGVITAVEIGDSSGALNPGAFLGTNYNKANVKIVGSGSGASIVPIFGPKTGLGADPRQDLRSTAIMFNIKPEGTVSGKWPVDNDYRQVGLLKNITDSAGVKFVETQGSALKKVEFTAEIAGGVSYANDIQVSGQDSDALGWVDYYDDSATLWYHQDEDTGFTPFTEGETCTIEGKAGTFTVKTLTDPDIDIFSGDLLFVNNTEYVTRDADQTEDIKLVIKL